MSGFRMPSTLTLGIGVLIAVAAVALGVSALGALAKPSDYEARLAALDETIARIEQIPVVQQPSGYSERSLCQGATLTASGALRGVIEAQATASGMTVKDMAVSPAAGGATTAGLTPIDVAFSAEGPYDGARRLIASLQQSSPEVFVDTLELRPSSGATKLAIKGRAFCWTSARP